MLETRDMRFGYTSERRILDGVSFESAAGEVVAVLGNNGAGKSTLIKCMDRILTPETGAVLVDGTDLLSLTRREHARCAAYVPQTPPKGSLTVFDAVLRRVRLHAFVQRAVVPHPVVDGIGIAGRPRGE